ncbi:hypothetical protein GJ496_004363 [Pomphorhynchus laevis]|nr:hypothetical protein GJ496_004363 [Pomphorhynchus laevis]
MSDDVNGVQHSISNKKETDSQKMVCLLIPPNDFCAPLRPGFGKEGRIIPLRANHFSIRVPRIKVHHYEVIIDPDKCPKRINREIIATLVSQYTEEFANVIPVYDGKHNLYTRNKMQFVDCLTLPVILKGSFEGQERLFTVKLKYKDKIDFELLDDALNGKVIDIHPGSMQALDVILRHLASLTHTPVGRSFFRQTKGRVCTYLGGGREVWFGFHQSIRPTFGNISLNIDVSATAFYRAQSILKLTIDILDLNSYRDLEKPLSDLQRLRLTKELKGLKVEVNHCGSARRKYRVSSITKRPTKNLFFPSSSNPDQMINVAAYFKERHKLDIIFLNLPCLQIGPDSRHTFLPFEVCEVVPGQRCIKKLSDSQTSTMIKATARSAPNREQDIKSLINQADFSSDPYLKDFGINVKTSMVEIPGRVLDPPQIRYTDNIILPNHGVWDMRGKKFHKSYNLEKWAIISFASQKMCSESSLRLFSSNLQRISSDAGIEMNPRPVLCKYAYGVDQVEPLMFYLRSTFPGIQLVIPVLPGKTPVYAEIKRVGDTLYGMATQCVQVKNVNRTTPQTLSNLCLKINVKLGGINNILIPSLRPISVFNEPVMFIGAAITHPPAGDKSKPSIAAVVASMDAHPSRYAATVRIQIHRQEYIKDLARMVRNMLLSFYRSTSFKPYKLIIYRDGLSECHGSKIFEYELMAIREACVSIEASYQPGITYVAVQKRHHTRFFCVNPNDQSGKSGNVPPGTTVDTTITQPSEYDFFICSHAGIQGTSRPSHYYVLWDDNKLQPDDLQAVTYQLCHTYVRCTRSVSIPAPAYYAHLVAFRARHHLIEREYPSMSGTSASQGSSHPASELRSHMVNNNGNDRHCKNKANSTTNFNGSESYQQPNSSSQLDNNGHKQSSQEQQDLWYANSAVETHIDTSSVMYFA